MHPAFKFFWWSLKTTDWGAISMIGFSVSMLGYAVWDYQRMTTKDQYMPSAKKELQHAGRFANSFPQTSDQYQKTATDRITVDELEWQIRDRQKRYQQYLNQNESK